MQINNRLIDPVNVVINNKVIKKNKSNNTAFVGQTEPGICPLDLNSAINWRLSKKKTIGAEAKTQIIEYFFKFDFGSFRHRK